MKFVISKLLERPYYYTVYIGFIEEAVEECWSMGVRNVDEIDAYIRENLI